MNSLMNKIKNMSKFRVYLTGVLIIIFLLLFITFLTQSWICGAFALCYAVVCFTLSALLKHKIN